VKRILHTSYLAAKEIGNGTNKQSSRSCCEAARWRLQQANRARETMKLAAERGDAAGGDITA